MVSIPGARNQTGQWRNRLSLPPAMPTPPNSPQSPGGSTGSWADTMADMNRQLKNICRSPSREESMQQLMKELHADDRSPIEETFKSISVRHELSHKKLEAQLDNICKSPTRRAFIDTSAGRPRALSREHIKKKEYMDLFRCSFEIGHYGAEDIDIYVVDKKLVVSAFKNHSRNVAPDWCQEAVLPDGVDPESLVCLVRHGTLDVRQSLKYHPSKDKKTVIKNLTVTEYQSDRLKIVMRVPVGCNPRNTKLHTVDDKMTITVYDSDVPYILAQTKGNCPVSFYKEFILPETVDPMDTRANLSDHGVLLLDAPLKDRQRYNSF